MRLRAAAALSLLPLGLAWGSRARGADVPARVFLVLAAVALLAAATRNRAQVMNRAAGTGAGATGAALALALAAHAVAAVACLAGAITLVIPLVRPRKPGVFVPAPVRR